MQLLTRRMGARHHRTFRQSTRLPLALAAVLCAAASAALPGTAAAATPVFRTTAIGPTFDQPTWIGTAPGSEAIYVAQQNGIVRRIVGGSSVTFLDLRSSVSTAGEQGLLALAFSARYPADARVWAWFTGRDGNGEVRQFNVRNGAIVNGSGKTTLRVPLSPPAETNHNGGQLWSRADGTLWLSVGDGGGAGDPENNAQRLNVPRGKMLRFIPNAAGGASIPADNPFRNRAGAVRTIWALGLRNPFRFSFDRATGDLWMGDVGQGQREEINHVASNAGGANFGWRRFEGSTTYSSSTAITTGTRLTKPFLEYGHNLGRCSVTGGVVYRGAARPALRSWYLYADFCDNRLYGVHTGTRALFARELNVPGIVAFGQDRNSEVLFLSRSTGRAYRIL